MNARKLSGAAAVLPEIAAASIATVFVAELAIAVCCLASRQRALMQPADQAALDIAAACISVGVAILEFEGVDPTGVSSWGWPTRVVALAAIVVGAVFFGSRGSLWG